MKTCPRCRRTLPVTAFGTDCARSDGRSFYCLACNAANSRLARARGVGRWERSRYHRRPEVWKAHVYVGRAVRAGKLVKPALCPSCAVPGRRIEAHHHRGYAREHWLDVVWLCRPCHALEHTRKAAQAAPTTRRAA